MHVIKACWCIDRCFCLSPRMTILWKAVSSLDFFWINPSLWAQVNKQRPSSAYSLPLPPFSSSMGIFSSASVPFWVIIYQSTLLSKGILHLKTCICWLLLLCYWVTLLTFLTHLRCGSVSLVCLTCSTSHGHSYTWVRPTCILVKKTSLSMQI